MVSDYIEGLASYKSNLYKSSEDDSPAQPGRNVLDSIPDLTPEDEARMERAFKNHGKAK